MAVESVTWINDLNVANPVGASSTISEADDHIRNLKVGLKNSLPGLAFPHGWVDESGSVANTYVCTLVPAPAAYAQYMTVWTLISATVGSNTTSTPTLNVNGLGARTIIQMNGLALEAGMIRSGGIHGFIYDGTNMRLLNPALVDGTFLATMNGTQAIATGTPEKLELDTEAKDSNGEYDAVTNYRWTPGVGWYLMFAQINYSNIGSDNVYRIRIYKNGSNEFDSLAREGGASATATGIISLTRLILGNASDYYEVWADHSKGSNATVSTDGTWFGAFRIK